MKAKWKILAVLSAIVIIVGGLTYHNHPHAVKAAICRIIPGKTVGYSGVDILYADMFNDINRKHLKAAEKKGLQEIPQTRKVINTDGLVKVSTGRSYCVDPLSHSVPYLVSGAADELKAIGDAFISKLESEGLPSYRIIVTSVLRTKEDVDNLRKVNGNSSENSAHCYGTTFDISWSRYNKVSTEGKTMTDSDLKTVLGEVLKAEKKAGRIYVKYEIRQKCFHITSRI